MKIKLLSSAFRDLLAGRQFYEKVEEGLCGYFFDSLFSDIDSPAFFDGINQKIFGDHRMLSKHFPFAIYYKVGRENTVVV